MLGFLLSQQIYYWESDTLNDTEKVKVLFLPETTVRLKNLTSHTRYLVCISAFNAAGDGPRSSPTQGRTHQAGTGPWPAHLDTGQGKWGQAGGHCCLDLHCRGLERGKKSIKQVERVERERHSQNENGVAEGPVPKLSWSRRKHSVALFPAITPGNQRELISSAWKLP